MKIRPIYLLVTIVMLIAMITPAFADENHMSVNSEARSKAGNALKNLADSTTEQRIQIAFFITDIDNDCLMQEFKKLYPQDYQLYCGMTDDATYVVNPVDADINLKDCEGHDLDNPQIDDRLQLAIEHKRSVYKQAYASHNNSFLEQFPNITPVFISEYAPFMIAEADFRDVEMLENSEDVIYIDLFANEKSETEDLGLANTISRANYVRDTCGNRGAGVKIGLVEAAGIPDENDSYLSNANIVMRAGDTATDTHATLVARILVGSENNGDNDGLAPAATLYCCIGNNETSFYSGIEWLIGNGVNVINASLGWSGNAGEYDTKAKWIDHIAGQHDVHFVKSAGNNGGLITSPGMAYNAITVGGFNSNNSTDIGDFSFWSSSSYQESGATRAEKPNLVAASTGFWGYQGTSFAAPQVTGVIAQLCSYKSALKIKQTAVGAILAASSANKVECVGNGEKGDVFADTTDNLIATNNLQISNRAGAGILDARWARGIAYYGHYWSYTIVRANFPYVKTITINTSGNSLTRIAIFWLKRNTVSGTHATASTDILSCANLNLEVFDPDGNSVGKSQLLYSNFEIVQFIPPKSGTYQIKISSVTCNDREHVGIAVW